MIGNPCSIPFNEREGYIKRISKYKGTHIVGIRFYVACECGLVDTRHAYKTETSAVLALVDHMQTHL